MDHPLFDYRLLIVVAAVLLCLGLLMVISSSSVIAAATYQDPYYFGKRQLIFAGIGLLGAFFLSRCSEKLVRYVAWPALFLAALLIVLTIFTPLGIDVAGNRNWMSFGPSWTQFQPSEFAKLAIIIWGANDLANKRRVLVDMRQWLTYLCATLLLVGLVLIQKDAGTAMVMAAIIIIVMVAVGAPWRLLAGFGISAVGAMAIMVLLEPYRMQRILAFLRPDSDPLGYNLQARRGIYALASGGWFGQGLGSSRQKWGLLTEAHTDYIFAIIGEELGLLGTLTVILLFLILTAVGLRIALKSKSLFSKYVAIGVVAWFAAQAFANIAVAIRLIPVLGIPLPMISYGGSSLMANLFALGLLAGCARREPHAAQVFLTRKAKPKVTTIVRAQA
jgi:cell division protein FtsW